MNERNNFLLFDSIKFVLKSLRDYLVTQRKLNGALFVLVWRFNESRSVRAFGCTNLEPPIHLNTEIRVQYTHFYSGPFA
jgi:hypothetical protein